MRIVIIGLGGIGSVVSEYLCMYLNSLSIRDNIKFDVLLIDGDKYEEKNKERQKYKTETNKAYEKYNYLSECYKQLSFDYLATYITPDNVDDIIRDDDTIMMCVDNNKSRNWVGKCGARHNSINIISGGNDYTTGSVTIHIRKDGKDITPTIYQFHPEIDNPEDRGPGEPSCQQLQQSIPQLLFANVMAASWMLWAFYNFMQGKVGISDIYFDGILCSALPKKYLPS